MVTLCGELGYILAILLEIIAPNLQDFWPTTSGDS